MGAPRSGSGWRAAFLAALVATGSPWACADSPTQPEPPRVTRIVIAPDTLLLTDEQSVVLAASVLDQSGQTMSKRPTVWGTSAPSVATVDSTGTVHGHSAGTATIFATLETVTSAATVIVSASGVASVLIAPSASRLTIGTQRQYQAETRSPAGRVLTGRAVSWSVSDTTVARVSPAGLLTGVALGTTQLVATSEGRSASVSVQISAVPIARVDLSGPDVTSVGRTLSISAAVTDSLGRLVPAAPLRWLSLDPTVATVSQAGLVTGLRAGTTAIIVIADQISASSGITVAAVPVAAVRFSQDTLGDFEGGRIINPHVDIMDSTGARLIDDRYVTYSIDDTSLVGMYAVRDGHDRNPFLITKRVHGDAMECTALRAESEGLTAGQAICALPLGPSTGEISETEITIPVGGEHALAMKLFDAYHNEIPSPNPPVRAEWQAVTSILSVSSTGVVRGLAPGRVAVLLVARYFDPYTKSWRASGQLDEVWVTVTP